MTFRNSVEISFHWILLSPLTGSSQAVILSKMAYKMYRGTTLGETLQETLDYLIQFGDLNPNLAEDVLDQFDRSVNRLLRHNDKPQLTFKGDKLDVYRFCDKVWILILKDVVFYERDGREKHEILHVGKMKIVACETRIGM